MDELSENGRRRVLRILARVAWVDGAIDPREGAVLERYAAELGLDPAEADAIVREAKDCPLRIGATAIERRLLARGMIEVAAADGVLHPSEERLLGKLAEAVGLPQEALEEAVSAAFAERAVTPGAAVARIELRGALPPTVTREGVLAPVVRTIEQIGRWERLIVEGDPPQACETIVLEVQPEEHRLFGAGFGLTLRLLNTAGQELESHAMGVIGDGEGIPGSFDQLACALATADAYPELMKARGSSGDLRHPSVVALDPHDAELFAITACFNVEPRGLQNAAQRLHDVARHHRDVRLLLDASELWALAGDLDRAEQVLRDASGTYPADPLRTRLRGLQALRTLGLPELARLLLWLGVAGSSALEARRIQAVLNRLAEAAGDAAVAAPDSLLGLQSSIEGLMQLVEPSFGQRAAKLALAGVLFHKLAQAGTSLDGSETYPLVCGVRPYLQPVIGPKSFVHLLDLLVRPEAGADAFVAKLLRHLEQEVEG